MRGSPGDQAWAMSLRSQGFHGWLHHHIMTIGAVGMVYTQSLIHTVVCFYYRRRMGEYALIN